MRRAPLAFERLIHYESSKTENLMEGSSLAIRCQVLLKTVIRTF